MKYDSLFQSFTETNIEGGKFWIEEVSYSARKVLRVAQQNNLKWAEM